jgi:hypothetical protein
MKPLAPIVLFTYKRRDTLIQTVQALQKNRLASNSDLIVFSDAARTKKDHAAVAAVREFIKSISGFRSIQIYEASTNKGLANSIIGGVTEVLKQHDRVIVLEDDLITSTNFLCFMNDCLSKYRNDENVFSISGYSFNLNVSNKYEYDTYFLNRGWSWGWATWRDRWVGLDWEVKDYQSFTDNKLERKEFAKGGSDLNGMLRKQMNGELDSWAIRWFYNQYKQKGLTVYPVYSTVYNNGFDQKATHTSGSSKRYIPLINDGSNSTFNFQPIVSITDSFQKRFQNKMGILARIRSKVETILGL